MIEDPMDLFPRKNTCGGKLRIVVVPSLLVSASPLQSACQKASSRGSYIYIQIRHANLCDDRINNTYLPAV